MCFLTFRCKITTIKLYEQTILHRCGLEVVCFITYFSQHADFQATYSDVHIPKSGPSRDGQMVFSSPNTPFRTRKIHIYPTLRQKIMVQKTNSTLRKTVTCYLS